MTVRVATDIHDLGRVANNKTVVQEFSKVRFPADWGRRWRLLRAALSSDHLVIHFFQTEVLFFTVLLFIIPFHRCRITTLDFFTGDLKKRKGILGSVVGWSLRRVERFLVYFRDSSVFEEAFGIPRSRFHYIDYKINSIELIRQASVTDEGYIFCGGRSRRDFACLFQAVAPLGYPVKLVTSPESGLLANGSTLAGVPIPPSVEILTHDASAEFFLRWMAGARLVVIPIVPNVTTQAGIAVYLQAMGLGKCVIVSSGLGVGDVLDRNQAWIVDAGDSVKLREAIRTVWNDPEMRNRYGQAARSYALPLGGEDELRRRILESLP